MTLCAFDTDKATYFDGATASSAWRFTSSTVLGNGTGFALDVALGNFDEPGIGTGSRLIFSMLRASALISLPS
jgi:hypothetical protein